MAVARNTIEGMENLKGEELLSALKADHWFWHWGSETWREDFGVPEGMVSPGFFINLDTHEAKSFLEQLQADGIELSTAPSNIPEKPLFHMDRVKFMEWLILRYLKHTPTYSGEDLEIYAARKVEQARAVWEEEHEDCCS